MKRIIITYPTPIDNEFEQLKQLFEDGLDFLHLRKPDFSIDEMLAYIANIPSEYYSRIMLHSHFDLVYEYGLAGINLNRKHLGQMIPKEEVDKCFIQPLVYSSHGVEVNRHKIENISYSAHSFDEIANLPFIPNYVFLSPIFDSISKIDYTSNFSNHHELSRKIEKSSAKIIALGGIDDAKVKICEKLGFYGYAMLGNVWETQLISIDK